MPDKKTAQTAELLAERASDRVARINTELAHAERENTRLQELSLYLNDRPAWIKQAAQNIVKLMATWSDAALSDTWGKIGHDYRKEIWKHLDTEQRDRLKRVRASQQTETQHVQDQRRQA